MFIFILFERQRYIVKRDFSICRFTPQMSPKARVGPGPQARNLELNLGNISVYFLRLGQILYADLRDNWFCYFGRPKEVCAFVKLKPSSRIV